MSPGGGKTLGAKRGPSLAALKARRVSQITTCDVNEADEGRGDWKLPAVTVPRCVARCPFARPAGFRALTTPNVASICRYDDRQQQRPGLLQDVQARSSQVLGSPQRPVLHPSVHAGTSQLAQLEGANQQLRTRLQEVLGELRAAQGELTSLRQMEERWEQEAPDAAGLVQVALARERAAQDARSERVLAVLQAKARVTRWKNWGIVSAL